MFVQAENRTVLLVERLQNVMSWRNIPALDGSVPIALMSLLERMVSMGYALEERDHCCQNATIGVRVKLEKCKEGVL